MSSTAAATTNLSRKKRSILWVLGGLFLLLLAMFFFQLFGPNPPIIVSRQTTYLTEPLGPNGLPDYEKHVLELSSRGVTPENNAAVPLFQALFPNGLDPEHAQAVVTELGMKEVPSSSNALEPIEGEAFVGAQWQLWEWLCDRWPNQRDLSDADGWAERMVDQAVWRPWTSDQMSPLSKWLTRNKRQLDLIVEASRRPQYFTPSPTLVNNKRDLLVDMTFPQAQNIYHACRALLARAMWHSGEGRTMDAWQDVHALHRLSGLLSQGVIPGEQSKSRDVNAMACYATATLLDHGKPTADEARQIHRDLSCLRRLSGVARSLEHRERMLALDALVYAGSTGDLEQLGRLDEQLGMIVEMRGQTTFIDWNVLLGETNRGYDRLIVAARLKDRKARIRAINEIEKDQHARFVSRARTLSHFLAGEFSLKERSELFANLILSGLLSSFERALAADDRANATLELTRVAAALAIYRAEHNRYPEKFDDLLPGTMNELPRDLFDAKPYTYQPEGRGYLLYSAGENGIDDGGRNAHTYFLESPPFDERGRTGRDTGDPNPEVEMGGDDISIRVPRPVIELPKLAAPDSE